MWVRKDSVELSADNIDWTDRGTADGNSVQPDSDFGEYLVTSSNVAYYSKNILKCKNSVSVCLQHNPKFSPNPMTLSHPNLDFPQSQKNC